jgi:hypothetical protein
MQEYFMVHFVISFFQWFASIANTFTFQKRGRNVHLAIDGWTAPIVASYLGIVVIWYDKGKTWRAILEFIW